MGRSSKKTGPMRRVSDARLSRWQSWAVIASVALAFAIWLAPNPFDDDGGSRVESAPRASHLEPVSMTVREIHKPYQRHARLEVTFHNTGGQLVVVSEARVRIRRVYELRPCFPQGDLPLSNTYGVLLPIDARPGALVRVPLHQQIGADEADRFGILFGARANGKREVEGTYLFELDIALVTDGPRSPMSLGQALVSLPELPYPGNYYWGDKTAEFIAVTYPHIQGKRSFRRHSMPCWKRNTTTLRNALSGPAVRSPELGAISETLVAPSISAIYALEQLSSG